MDFGRSRDERDSRGLGRGSTNRERPRYSRDHSPSSSTSQRPQSQSSSSYQSIPLRPAHPQRFPEFQSSNSSHWRPDNSSQLPARPVQRYRNPATPAPVNATTRAWEARPRELPSGAGRGWTRDEFSTGTPRGGGSRPSMYRDPDAGRADRENRDRRPYQQENSNSRHFEIPFRSRGSIKKRTRESSEDPDDFSARARPRGGSAERRGRNAPAARNLERRIGDYVASKPSLATRLEDRPRRLASPSFSDRSTYDQRVPAGPSDYRANPRRSYSPGEISEGPARSVSPASRSESRSITNRGRSVSRSRTTTPPGSRQHSGTPPPRSSAELLASEAQRRVNAASEQQRISKVTDERQPSLITIQRSQPIRSPDRDVTLSPPPRVRQSTPPSVTADTSPALSLRRVEADDPSVASPPSPPRRDITLKSPTSSPNTYTPPPVSPVTQRQPLVEVASPRQHVKVFESPRGVKLFEIIPIGPASVPKTLPLTPVFHPSPPASPSRDLSSHLGQAFTSRKPAEVPDRAVTATPPPRHVSPTLISIDVRSDSPISPRTTVDVDMPMAPVLTASPPIYSPSDSQKTEADLSLAYAVPRPESTSDAVMADLLPTAESLPQEVDATQILFDTGRRDDSEVRMDTTMDSADRSVSPEPHAVSAPLSPPRDFSLILGSIIVANEVDSGEVNELMELNRRRTEKERMSEFAFQDLTRVEALSYNQLSHDRLLPYLQEGLVIRDARRGQKTVELRAQYKVLNDDWRAHCQRLDRVKDRVHRRNQPATPSTPFIDPSGLPVYPDQQPTLGQSLNVGRANRRNTNAAYGYGDAVRSEAEFLEILASLETADMQDPNVRATRTAAVVPDMVVDDSERQDLLAFEDRSRLVEDPVDFYSLRAPLDLWTQDEVQIFCKRFSQHPKQFGRIATDLPEKTTAQCVLFYYRMKTTIDFRSLSERRGDGRRRKPRRRIVDADGKAKKGVSLMSNLERARPDSRDDDESPPPSPKQRSSYIAESPSVYALPDSTSRPAPREETMDIYEDMRGPPAGRLQNGKKARTPKLRDAHLLNHSPNPPSDSMLEAAEALGSLSGFSAHDNDEYDDGDGKSKRSKAEAEAEKAARRKSASSSYWAVAERNEFIRILALYGKDWNRLAEGLENKTPVQCRNWFQNHSKKLNLHEIARASGQAAVDDIEEESAPTSVIDQVLPTLPLGPSPVSNGIAMPQAGFFVSERVSPLPPQPIPLPAIDLPLSVSTIQQPKSSMPLRNLLNDDAGSEEHVLPSAKNDWFGGSLPEPVGAPMDDGSITTEDEAEPARLPNPAPVTYRDYGPPPRRTSDQFAPSSYRAPPRQTSGSDYASESPASAYHDRPSTFTRFISSGNVHDEPRDRYDSPVRPRVPSISSQWQSSSVSHYPPPFGPPSATSQRPSTGHAQNGDFYRRLDSNGSLNSTARHYAPRGHEPPQRSSFALPKTVYDRPFNSHSPAFAPHPSSNRGHPSSTPSHASSHYDSESRPHHRSNSNPNPYQRT